VKDEKKAHNDLRFEFLMFAMLAIIIWKFSFFRCCFVCFRRLNVSNILCHIDKAEAEEEKAAAEVIIIFHDVPFVCCFKLNDEWQKFSRSRFNDRCNRFRITSTLSCSSACVVVFHLASFHTRPTVNLGEMPKDERRNGNFAL